MASLSQTNFTYTIIAFILLLIISTQCGAQLSPTFYDATCPNALNTIRTGIRNAVSREIRMAASSFASISMIDSFKVGGPSWTVKLGRRDSTTACRSFAENLPSFTDGLDKLISTFATKGLNAKYSVALSSTSISLSRLAKHNMHFSVKGFITIKTILMLDLKALEDVSLVI
ncbi:hypothetical protein CUMW_247020 [Citrus unshiu]|uniref:peroxidase n=1 Tax=Citrus unshiu TaxID=55188 RepID=A0A2H5QNQ1_CITUN|nr:hypothetical protein CUMW_247020 [Citrus unshiu]